jgi:hypothetical protein
MNERIAKFVEAVKDDPRVLGIARFAERPPDFPDLVIVTTWDGAETMPAELPRMAGPLVGEGAPLAKLHWPTRPGALFAAAWVAVGVDGSRVTVGLRRAGDLVPDFSGREAEILHDPRRVLETWQRASRAASDEQCLSAWPKERDATDAILILDNVVRDDARRDCRPWPQADWKRTVRQTLDPSHPAQEALAARLDEYLRATPGAAEGRRVLAGEAPVSNLDSFLSTADAEGFKGDRVLFGEAMKRLRDLAKREPVFDQGFVVPTFDAVEAAFALGEAVGGCQPPLVPGVWVGVGVTPKDALEFWAAPFVRDPTCSVACVDDTGERDVVLRSAGREPMVAALTTAVDAAFDRLPALIDAARDASKESVDPSAAMSPLHLPQSFVERAKRRGADALMCSRLAVALSLARAGHDCAPLAARKLGLAAGRVIAKR